MNNLTFACCLELLQRPELAAALRLADAVGVADVALAERLRTFVQTGMTEYGYVRSTGPDGIMPIYVAARVIPAPHRGALRQ